MSFAAADQARTRVEILHPNRLDLAPRLFFLRPSRDPRRSGVRRFQPPKRVAFPRWLDQRHLTKGGYREVAGGATRSGNSPRLSYESRMFPAERRLEPRCQGDTASSPGCPVPRRAREPPGGAVVGTQPCDMTCGTGSRAGGVARHHTSRDHAGACPPLPVELKREPRVNGRMLEEQMSTDGNTPTVQEKLAQWELERDLRDARPVAVYVSTPITTGRRFIQWWRQHGAALVPGSQQFATSLRAEVILPNVQRTARFLELLRWRHVGVIIDPTSFDVPGWTQESYNEFWAAILERHVKRVIFLGGWEYSRGCVQEFETAQRLGIDCVDEELSPLTREAGLTLIGGALSDARAAGIDVAVIAAVHERMTHPARVVQADRRELYKDEVLDHLARTANVAQFVSFGPGSPSQRYCRIRGFSANQHLGTLESAVASALAHAPEGAVNIRSFDPRRPEGNPFLKRLTTVDDVACAVRNLAGAGLYTIVNEVIDESDGGVSGVAYRGLLEFAPGATPRCVDDVDIETATLPFEQGMAVLRAVYGFEPDLRGREGARVEFSIHPAQRGWRAEHTVLWQSEQRPAPELKADIRWPNRFSRLIGDKAYGLAVAAAAGLPVPRTIVFARHLFPFEVGSPTGSGVLWTRTCPEIKAPGLYPSAPEWRDPLAVLLRPEVLGPIAPQNEDAPPLASVLVQEGVAAMYSGTAAFNGSTAPAIAGVRGRGDSFMLGDAGAESLPESVTQSVLELYGRVWATFGPHLLEWVFDGLEAWIVQLSLSRDTAVYSGAGDANDWEEFRFEKGSLELFRSAVSSLRGTGKGIVVLGNVSALSHAGEIAEQYGVPARFVNA
jgi:hypothetical protein